MNALCCLAACAATLSSIPVADDELAARVDALLERWTAAASPGGAVAVLRGGEPVLVRVFGSADLAAELPITADTCFYIASLAKPFTAAAALHADRAGALDLDASVRELFPELPEAWAAATLRHLVHHASGIPDVYDAVVAADLGAGAVSSNAAAIAVMKGLPGLSFTPGERFLYSNSGYVLLAEALERATEKDLAHYAREHLFEPSGMQSARYLGPGEQPPIRSYRSDGAGGHETRALKTGLRGPGGMVASLDDLIHFEQAWRAGRFGGEGLREELLVARYASHPMLGTYAAGWMLRSMRGARVERHFGGAFGFSSDLRRFPEHDLTVIALSNTDDLQATDLAEQVALAALGDAVAEPEGPLAVELDAASIARFGRMWRSIEDGMVWAVIPQRGGFGLASLGDVKLNLVPVSTTRLDALDAQVPFALEFDGDELVVLAEQRTTRLERIPFPPTGLPPIGDYAGSYRSTALGATIHLDARGAGALVLRQERPILELTPFLGIAPDLFVCDRGVQIDFERDGEGNVAGMTVRANRAWGMRFERVSD